GWLALLRFPAQRSPRLPNFEVGRKDVRLAALVLLCPGLGRAGQNCAVDRAVQTGLVAGKKTCLSRMAGTARTTSRSAGGEGIEEARCHAVFAHVRHPLHLTSGCGNDRAHSVVWR